MKLKYKFEKIRSAADTLEVKCRDFPILHFTQTDYGEGFKNLVGKEFLLEPLDCNDVSTLTVNGAEAHTAEYTDDVAEAWKEETYNIIGTDHFSDPGWVESLDMAQPVKVYSQGEQQWPNTNTIRNLLASFINSKGVCVANNYKFDFSNYYVENCNSASVANSLLYYGDNIAYGYTNLVTKLPNFSKIHLDENTGYVTNIPNFSSYPNLEETCDLNYDWIRVSKGNSPVLFSGCTYLKKATKNCLPPMMDNSISKEYVCASAFKGLKYLEEALCEPYGNASSMFYGCTSLKKAGYVGNVTNLNSTFHGCTSLEEVPDGIKDMRPPSGSSGLDCSYAFSGCTSLKEAVLPSVPANVSYMYSNCTNLQNVDFSGIPLDYYSGPCACMPRATLASVTVGDIDILRGRSYAYGISQTMDSVGVINIDQDISKIVRLGTWSITSSTSSTALETYAAYVDSSCRLAFVNAYDYVVYGLFNDAYKIKAFPLNLGCTSYEPLYKTTISSGIGYSVDPLYLFSYSRSQSIPNSDGYEWWVDSIPYDTDYVKTITNKSLNIEVESTTVRHEDTYILKIPYSEILRPVDSYPYEFTATKVLKLAQSRFAELDTSTRQKITATEMPGWSGRWQAVSKDFSNRHNWLGTETIKNDTSVFYPFKGVTVANVNGLDIETVFNDEEGCIELSIPCINIEDDSVSSIHAECTDIWYVAEIDGHEFHGTAMVDLNIAIKWTVDEDVDYSVELVDDDYALKDVEA